MGVMAQHGRTKRGAGRVVAAIVSAVAFVAIGVAVAIAVVNPALVGSATAALGVEWPLAAGFSAGADSHDAREAREASASDRRGFTRVGDSTFTTRELQAIKEQEYATPLVARCNGVDLRCPVSPADLTGILFHQASYGYALRLDTELPDADYEQTADRRSMRINRTVDFDQANDAWLDAEVLHIWRTTDATEMDTSIDIGALAGTTIVSPVSGTVVLVKDYQLYDEMPDVEIHIRPDGRDDLDCVLIHTTDAAVAAGEHVEAGKTPLAKVRDIEAFLTDVQLGFFTPEGVGGNHTHVQMNDANYPGYREKKLEGAVA